MASGGWRGTVRMLLLLDPAGGRVSTQIMMPLVVGESHLGIDISKKR